MTQPHPPEFVSVDPDSYAYSVLHERHPAMLAQIRDAYPYGPKRLRALDDLLAEITEGTVRPLPDAATWRATWDKWGAGRIGARWDDVPFLWAESFFYAKLLDAVGFWGGEPSSSEPSGSELSGSELSGGHAGLWVGVDPFEAMKSRELTSPEVQTDLARLDTIAAMPVAEQTRTLIEASLWGNRADLGFLIGAATGGEVNQSHLVADDGAELLAMLDNGGLRRLCVVADNAGRELLADLVLIDHLLVTGAVESVDLHVKPHPYYVSDATTADLVAVLRRLSSGSPTAGHSSASGAVGRSGASGAVGGRLHDALQSGRIRLYTHRFYGAPASYHQIPDDLRERFMESDGTLLKGDLNYRRLVGDFHWPATTPFADVTAYFPTPVVTLRTLKFDVLVGVRAETVAALDATGERWRTSGRYGLIQVRR